MCRLLSYSGGSSSVGVFMSAAPPLVRRFVAGSTWQDALPHCKSLAAQGIRTTLNILGEDLRGEQESRAMQREYLDLVARMDGSSSYLSIKLTMLGLMHSEELACELLDGVLQEAAARGVFVRIDMEGSAWTEQTVAIYARMKKKYPALGIVLQAYLKRTRADLERLQAVDAKVRLCKGAYKESPDIALQDVQAIRQNYIELAEMLLHNFSDAAFATHDDLLIARVRELAQRHGVSAEQYEFQMLYGMRRRTWLRLRAQGCNLRIYIPFGRNWLPYFSRRLLERKENFFFLLRNLFRA